MEQEGLTLIIIYTTLVILLLAIAFAFVVSLCLYKKDKLRAEIKSLKKMINNDSSQRIKQ